MFQVLEIINIYICNSTEKIRLQADMDKNFRGHKQLKSYPILFWEGEFVGYLRA